MERGVVVGGLMICGSFLLAALLNRSAMEEVPESTPVAPVDVPVPAVVPVVAPPMVDAKNDPDPTRCPDPATSDEADTPTTNDATDPQADLMVNGPESCVP